MHDISGSAREHRHRPHRHQPFARTGRDPGSYPQRLNLHIGSGEAVGLVGPSGSGKSTLLMVMAGLERPDTGTVRVAGEDLRRARRGCAGALSRPPVGIVFQSFHLIPTMTALENVAIPLELAGARDASARAARRARGRRPCRPASAIIRPSCRAASSSGSRSPAPWRPSPRSCSPTSRPAISTRRPARQIVDLLFAAMPSAACHPGAGHP